MSVRDGIVGFALFFAHWLSPETGKASLNIDYSKIREPKEIVCKCKFDIAWNNQLEQLVDAGIPLQFKIRYFTDISDTLNLYRSLHFNMVDYTYQFIDSTINEKRKSKQYSLIDLALRDFCRWDIVIPEKSAYCKVEVMILPSRAEQMNRMVDMSRVWGQQRVFIVFKPEEKLPKKKSSKKND